MQRWLRESPEAHEPFKEAKGQVEFTTDGTCVNTHDGWREMRVGIFSKREPGPAADASTWADRQLPRPHVRVAFAAIEKSDRFVSRWGHWSRRLGVQRTSELSDGAPWIWEGASMHFAGHDGVLDIYHALEHVAEATRGLFGEGTEEAAQWLETSREALLSGGWDNMWQVLRDMKEAVSRSRWNKHGRPLSKYLSRRREELNYPSRLHRGLPIGSGQVEGACKQMIGRRLKQTGARWRIRRVNRMAGLVSQFYSEQWEKYWQTKT
jgi:hypothetical protein